MPLRFVIGRVRSGKTSAIIREIREAVTQGTGRQLLLVPEQYSHEAERELCAACGDRLSLYAEVMSFTGLARWGMDHHGGAADLRMDEGGKLLCMAMALKELQPLLHVYGRAADNPDLQLMMLQEMERLRAAASDHDSLSILADELGGELGAKLKEMALVGLNAVKEMLEDEQIASLIEQIKARGINVNITGIDEAIANVEKSKEEELPQVDAGVYTNENTDVIVRVIVTQDGKEVAHSIGGKLGDGGVSEYQMGDKMAFSMRAGKEGVNMTVKAQGMDFGLTIVPEARENGAAAKATLTMNGMELMTAEFEKLDEATLKGLSVEAENVIDVTEFQDKEKAQELGKAMVEDMMKNYKPALKEKLEKVAPEMVEILFKVKELVKNNAGTIMQQLPAPAGN